MGGERASHPGQRSHPARARARSSDASLSPPLQLFARVAAAQPSLPLYGTLVRPQLKALLAVVEGTLGPAAKFVPSSTHVFLVALLLAVLVRPSGGGGGGGKASASRKR